MKNLNNQSGRSMIEMLGVLAIIGVLSVGGIAGYSKAMLKYKTNKTIDQIAMLTTNIRTLYAQQNTFDGLDEANATSQKLNAILMGAVPDEMQSSDQKSLVNPFAGAVTITVDNSVPGDAGKERAFIIGVNNIPREACMAVAVSDWGSNYSSGLIGMGISATTSSNVASDLLKAATDGTAGEAGVIIAGTCTSDPATSSQTYGAYCAKDLPIPVADASYACKCTGSECSVAIKYY